MALNMALRRVVLAGRFAFLRQQINAVVCGARVAGWSFRAFTSNQKQFNMAVPKTNAIDSMLRDLEQGRVSVDEITNHSSTVNSLASGISEPETAEAATRLLAFLLTTESAKTSLRSIVHNLFSCLQSSNNAATLQYALIAIGNLATNESNQTWLVSEHNAINVVLDVLKRSPHHQAHAFYALQQLSMGNENNLRLLFRKHHFHKFIRDAMTANPSNVVLQTQGCALLRRFCFLEETRSIFIIVYPAVLHAMRLFPSEAELVEHACVVLRHLTSDIQNIHVPYVFHQAVLAAMHAHADNIIIQQHACDVLFNLTCLPQHQKALTRHPYLIHEAILHTMRTFPEDAVIQENGCNALVNLTHDEEFRKELTMFPHLVHHVVLAAMRTHSDSAIVQRSGCGVLANLALDDQIKRKILHQPHLAHQTVLSAMRKHLKNAVVQKAGCDAIQNFFGDNAISDFEPYHLHEVVLAGMLVHTTDAAVQSAACAALANLALYEGSDLVRHHDAHTIIVNAMKLHHQHQDVQRNGVSALMCLSLTPRNHEALRTVGALEQCERAQQAFPDDTGIKTETEATRQQLFPPKTKHSK